ncbi:MAG: hypothetical protein ACFFA5_08940 [Promethearchaeota archaeon]
MDVLTQMIIGGITAFIAVIVLYLLSRWLQITDYPKTRLKQQLYQSGETVRPRKRRYFEQTLLEMPYFMAVHAIALMFSTLLILTLVSKVDLVYPIVYFAITIYAIFIFAKSTSRT